MKRIIFSWLFLTAFVVLFAQPVDYYNTADNKTGTDLQQALHDIIDDHTVLTYSYLWTAFQSTDKKADGTVWDMYSDRSDGPPPYIFNFITDQCGNYSGESSCYNREHSFPKSWFGDIAPMNTDLFHIYPTDGYVNGKRGNFPFGETVAPTWISQNGSELGPCSIEGYTGTVFEPIDEYKGDFARSYFYMAVRYYGEDMNWTGSPMVDGAQLLPWAKEMLLEWNYADTVSAKEINRNNAVYALQGNRNPFIDHPEYVNLMYIEEIQDETAPLLDSISILSASSIQLWFSEALDSLNALEKDNFTLSGEVAVANVSFSDTSRTSLLLETSEMQNASYILNLSGISDISGNKIVQQNYNFTVAILSILSAERAYLPTVYPNPSSGVFYIQLEENSPQINNIALSDVSGRIVAIQQRANNSVIEISTNGIRAYYFLQIIFEDGHKSTLPIIID